MSNKIVYRYILVVTDLGDFHFEIQEVPCYRVFYNPKNEELSIECEGFRQKTTNRFIYSMPFSNFGNDMLHLKGNFKYLDIKSNYKFVLAINALSVDNSKETTEIIKKEMRKYIRKEMAEFKDRLSNLGRISIEKLS